MSGDSRPHFSERRGRSAVEVGLLAAKRHRGRDDLSPDQAGAGRVTMPKLPRILGNLGAGTLLATAGMFFSAGALYQSPHLARAPLGRNHVNVRRFACDTGAILSTATGSALLTRVLLIASFACTCCLGLLTRLVAKRAAWVFEQHMIAS